MKAATLRRPGRPLRPGRPRVRPIRPPRVGQRHGRRGGVRRDNCSSRTCAPR